MNEEEFKKFEKINQEMKLGQEFLDFLNKEELPVQYLDIGYVDKIIKGSGGIPDEITQFFYYGFLMDGKEAILTSDKKIITNRQIKFRKEITGINEIKEFFDYNGTIGKIAPVINKKKIKEWFLNKDKINKKVIFQKVFDKINFYMDFGKDKNIIYTQACWVIATHCYPLFNWFPHILFNAPQESGKSKNAKLMMMLSFRGFNFGAVAGLSPPQFFRTLEDNRGTILIDEYERRDNSESQAIVNQMLNASASSDEFVIRLDQIDGKWISKQFPIFCPKILCNISGINPTSLSRFIVYQLTKTLDKEKGRRKPINDLELYDIRDEISLLILENWVEIKKIYDELELNFIGRDEDNWRSIYAIAKWIDEDITKYILDYTNTYSQIKVESHDTIGEFFIILYDIVKEEKQQYKPKDLAQNEFIAELLSYLKSPPTWIGKILKSYKFESVRGGSGKKYLLSKSIVGDVVVRYFGNIVSSIPPTQDAQDTQVNIFNNENNVTNVGSVACERLGMGHISHIDREKYMIQNIDLTILPCGFCGLIANGWTHEVKGKVCCDYCVQQIIQNPSMLKEEAIN